MRAPSGETAQTSDMRRPTDMTNTDHTQPSQPDHCPTCGLNRSTPAWEGDLCACHSSAQADEQGESGGLTANSESSESAAHEENTDSMASESSVQGSATEIAHEQDAYRSELAGRLARVGKAEQAQRSSRPVPSATFPRNADGEQAALRYMRAHGASLTYESDRIDAYCAQQAHDQRTLSGAPLIPDATAQRMFRSPTGAIAETTNTMAPMTDVRSSSRIVVNGVPCWLVVHAESDGTELVRLCSTGYLEGIAPGEYLPHAADSDSDPSTQG
jgi:hypothetical protein